MSTAQYVYVRNPHADPGNHDLYVVGFFHPIVRGFPGEWDVESVWPTKEEAAQRVHYLNGGTDFSKDIVGKVLVLEQAVSRLEPIVDRIDRLTEG
jgi:hypothetical protein